MKQASARSRSPTRLSPISKDRLRRRSSSSASRGVESFRRSVKSERRLESLGFQGQAVQPDTSQAFQSLSPRQDALQFSQFPFDESAILTDDEPQSQGQSPITPSSHNWQLPAQPFGTPLRAQSARVKDGQIIRITLKTQTTEVPCIAKCYLGRESSVVDDDFARNWAVKIYPVPKERWKDARHFCVLDVIDVETIGKTQQKLKIRLGKFLDQRFSVELGVDALKSLGLIDCPEAVTRSAPPSQYPSWNDINSSYMPQPQDVFAPYVLTPPVPQQFTTGRNRALTVPSTVPSMIPSIRIDTSFDTSLPLPMSMYDSGSGEDSSSPWDAISLTSQSFQDDDRSSWSPAVSECGGMPSYDTCMK
ncbi:hypothetical protein ACHAPU_003882 [Fusarium lateritium]